jgi:hypothetical protein
MSGGMDMYDPVDAPPMDREQARAAAGYVARRLGDECRDVLEALGLVGYVGYSTERTRPRVRVWREGAVG